MNKWVSENKHVQLESLLIALFVVSTENNILLCMIEHCKTTRKDEKETERESEELRKLRVFISVADLRPQLVEYQHSVYFYQNKPHA